MKLMFHTINFRYPNLNRGQAICQVSVYADEQDAIVITVQDERNNSNTSITNAAEVIANSIKQQILTEYVPDHKIRWFEIYMHIFPQGSSFDSIEFSENLTEPKWKSTTRHEIEQMIDDEIPNMKLQKQ